MAYTAEQLAQVRQAIIDLSTNKTVVRVTSNGRTVEYAQSDLSKLQALERQIAADVAAASLTTRRTRTRYVTTSKGL